MRSMQSVKEDLRLMNQKVAAVPEVRPLTVEADAALRAAREAVLDNSVWIAPLQTEMARASSSAKSIFWIDC